MIKKTQNATEVKSFPTSHPLQGSVILPTPGNLPTGQASDQGTHISRLAEDAPCSPHLHPQPHAFYPFLASWKSQPSAWSPPPDCDVSSRFHGAWLLPLKELQASSSGRTLQYFCAQPTDELGSEEEGFGAGQAVLITDLHNNLSFHNELSSSFLSSRNRKLVSKIKRTLLQGPLVCTPCGWQVFS